MKDRIFGEHISLLVDDWKWQRQARSAGTAVETVDQVFGPHKRPDQDRLTKAQKSVSIAGPVWSLVCPGPLTKGRADKEKFLLTTVPG